MPNILQISQRMRWLAIFAAVVAVLASMATFAGAAPRGINATTDNVAIDGYDPVAYFTDGKATKGSADHEVVWQDARWYFASEEHRKLFEAAPSRYAPQFGGWCAAGIAVGHYYAVDPETWTIVDGKLYLIHNREIAEKWQQDRAAKIAKAEQVWSEGAKAN